MPLPPADSSSPFDDPSQPANPADVPVPDPTDDPSGIVVAQLIDEADIGPDDTLVIGQPLDTRYYARQLAPVVVVTLVSLGTFLLGSVLSLWIGAVCFTGVAVTDLKNPAVLRETAQIVQSSRAGFLLLVLIPQMMLVLPCIVAAIFSPQGFKKRL
ncbi:MAG: hypothetical protein AAFP69_19120, partial [Planctomycetota bacterium]